MSVHHFRSKTAATHHVVHTGLGTDDRHCSHPADVKEGKRKDCRGLHNTVRLLFDAHGYPHPDTAV